VSFGINPTNCRTNSHRSISKFIFPRHVFAFRIWRRLRFSSPNHRATYLVLRSIAVTPITRFRDFNHPRTSAIFPCSTMRRPVSVKLFLLLFPLEFVGLSQAASVAILPSALS
jgi:hypothetical protein